MADGGPQDAIGVALPKPKRAFGRSLADFRIEGVPTPNGLHPAEERLLDCAARGTACRIASVRPEKAAPENTVRGAFLRFLLLGGDEDVPVHEKGVILYGGFIEGGIDLENARDALSLKLWRCLVSCPIEGQNSSIDRIWIQESQVGRVDFLSATIASDVYLYENLASGEICFSGAEIGGQLNCIGAKLKNAGGMALDCFGAKVTGSVFLQQGFEAEGGVRFLSAEIGGELNCNGAKLKNAGGSALNCGGAKVTGSVYLHGGFEADGEVSFAGAEIGGQLVCDGAKLKNAGGMALFCNGAKVTGDVFLQGFEAEGVVGLLGGEIGGSLYCSGAKLKNAGGTALVCDRAAVTGIVFLQEGFESEGEVRFCGAEICGDFVCIGGSFRNAKAAPSADKSEPPFAEDALNLQGAQIKGTLWLGPAAPPNHQQVTIEGSISLRGAHAHEFVDDRQSWPVAEVAVAGDKLPCYIHLFGFTYDRFVGGAKTDWRTRADWLMRQRPWHLGKDFRPQPFEQLIKVLREMGHDGDARRIAMLKECLLHKRKGFRKRPFAWSISLLWGLSCGYGYRPHRLIVALLALWLGCGFLYQNGAAHGGFAPKDGQVWTSAIYNDACGKNWTECAELKGGGGGKVGEIIAFNPFTYSADMLLPAIDLGQRSAWTPMGREIEVTLPGERKVTLPAGTLRVVTWIENILGVAGVILIGAILSGIVKRD